MCHRWRPPATRTPLVGRSSFWEAMANGNNASSYQLMREASRLILAVKATELFLKTASINASGRRHIVLESTSSHPSAQAQWGHTQTDLKFIQYRRLGGESDREIVFVSFVRACERSCVWPRDDVASEAGLRKHATSPDVPRALPFAYSKCWESVEKVFRKCWGRV